MYRILKFVVRGRFKRGRRNYSLRTVISTVKKVSLVRIFRAQFCNPHSQEFVLPFARRSDEDELEEEESDEEDERLFFFPFFFFSTFFK